jgi:hypothetical protein
LIDDRTGGQEGRQVTQGTPPARTDGSKLPPFDPSVPNPDTVLDTGHRADRNGDLTRLEGGKDNFAADRAAAAQLSSG